MRIWKFTLTLTDGQIIEMPRGAKPLSVQMQNGEVCLWVMVDPNEAKVPRKVYIVGTGNHMPEELVTTDFIGTVQERVFVWHVFINKVGA